MDQTESIGAALDRAVEIVETEKPSRLGYMYDWKPDALYLCTSGAFTIRQTAAIIQRNPEYVARHVREELAMEKRKPGEPRAYFGVSGKLNPKTLKTIRTLRTRIHMGDGLDDVTRAHCAAVVDDNTGVSVLAHLLSTDVKKLRRAIQYWRDKNNR